MDVGEPDGEEGNGAERVMRDGWLRRAHRGRGNGANWMRNWQVKAGQVNDQGSAVIEFVAVGLLLMLPLVYLILVLSRIQAASFAANGAAREAARAFVTADSNEEAERRAGVSTELFLKDHGFERSEGLMELTCSASPCLTPGERVEVEVRVTARFPFLPAGLAEALHTHVVVSSSQVAVVDEFREIRG
jgi:hypothetical protein